MHLGLDEKNFRRGHSYVTLLTDLEGARVRDVVEEMRSSSPPVSISWKT